MRAVRSKKLKGGPLLTAAIFIFPEAFPVDWLKPIQVPNGPHNVPSPGLNKSIRNNVLSYFIPIRTVY